jgi:cytochrome P450
MNSNTILNWEDVDYKAIYTRQLASNPLYWNEETNIWVAYSYDYCKAILLSQDVCVPEAVTDDNTPLNEKAVLLLRKFVRINNNEQHTIARQAALLIYNSMKPVAISDILETLLADIKDNTAFDWIATVCKKLPVLVVLKALGFSEDDCAFVVDNISSLVKIMSPVKTAEDIELINKVVDKFYAISEKYINSPGFIDHIRKSNVDINKDELVALFACNLVGLFIQCYDGGRGLLCNTFLSLVSTYNDPGLKDILYYKRLVTETLRFDPPVHNTRRIAVKDILIGGQLIKAGQSILIVIGAANLDPQVFENPELYDPLRKNNGENHTFGLGGHNCFAKYTMIDMATETCVFLTNKYKQISVMQQAFKYEAQLNVRLIKELMVKFL